MYTQTQNILDVTLLEPKQKHPTIFLRFDSLSPSEYVIIHNDHDPKPLYYQLLGERGNVFNWEYLEEGPEWWKVKITKKKKGETDESVGQLAANDIRKAKIFKKYGIDFCCGGKKTVKEACKAKGIDVTKVEKELQEADKNKTFNIGAKSFDFTKGNLDFLADYIVNIHHSYVKSSLPEIIELSEKVYKVHGTQHEELLQINTLIKEINSELTSHLIKEETVLFPYIKSLVSKQQDDILPFSDNFGSVQSPIAMMEMEHEEVGNHLLTIRRLTNDYALPLDACSSYGILYKLLEDFEEDLHMHIHLENNILFPRSLEVERNLIK